ncbi:MAG: exo-alpha-sialidase [Victivallales bacterium]|nr:exo-alpha-sialidase [Victivallales bacterium]
MNYREPVAKIAIACILILSGYACKKEPVANNYHDNTISWDEPELLAQDGEGHANMLALSPPKLVSKKGTSLYASWILGDNTFLARQDDQSGTWVKDIIPGARQGRGYWQEFRLEILPSGKLLLAQTNNMDVFFSSSDNSGCNWTAPIALNSNANNADKLLYYSNPGLAVDDDGTFYVLFWRIKDLAAKNREYISELGVSKDAGKTWTIQESRGIPYGYPAIYTKLAFVNGALYCLYGRNIYKTENNGCDWFPLKNFKGSGEQDFGGQNLVLRTGLNGEILVLWTKTTITKSSNNPFGEGIVEGTIDVILSVSENGGRNWRDSYPINDVSLPFVWRRGTMTERTMDALSKSGDIPDIFDMAIAGNEDLWAVSWFDYRDRTRKVWVSYTRDKGLSWAKNMAIPEIPADKQVMRLGLAIPRGNELYALFSAWTPKDKFSFEHGSLYGITGSLK